jgi:hypothetical protein
MIIVVGHLLARATRFVKVASADIAIPFSAVEASRLIRAQPPRECSTGY